MAGAKSDLTGVIARYIVIPASYRILVGRGKAFAVIANFKMPGARRSTALRPVMLGPALDWSNWMDVKTV